VYYCGQTCQRQAWKEHLKDCKSFRAQYRTIGLEVKSLRGNINHRTKKFTDPKMTPTPSKKHFIVKVQVALVPSGGREPGHMIYNEERSVMGILNRSEAEEVYERLKKQVEEKGVQGQKAFFYAISKGEKKGDMPQLEINPEVVLPAETW
jgi:hypothetical protein